MNRKNRSIVASLILALAVVSGAAISGQDRYTVKLPSGRVTETGS